MIDHNFGQQSVRTFWQGVNWENRPIVTNQSKSQALTVQDYFALIPWSGVAIAQSSSKPLPGQSSIKSETLEDFLNDFKFF
jgi:hypothetical protein